jgi:RES domain-containing protein
MLASSQGAALCSLDHRPRQMTVEFKSHRSYWDFAASVRRKWRFTRRGADHDFLEAVRSTLQPKIEIVPANARLWRAQLGHDWRSEQVAEDEYEDVPSALSPKRMKPLMDRSAEGRVNPTGIPCLYLATHEETAVAEVRPWIRAYVSLGRFVTNRELRLINCTTDEGSSRIYFEEPGPEERERENWRHIDRAFALPVSRTDESAEYVPTQILAELFRQEGFDGVGYRSAVGPGHNIALFDLTAADLEICRLVQVEALKVTYDDCDNPYSVVAPSRRASTTPRRRVVDLTKVRTTKPKARKQRPRNKPPKSRG